MISKPTIIILSCGIALRYWLAETSISAWLSERQEISTPLTSWKRVTEGLALKKAGISPYVGDIFHETPLMMVFLRYFINLLGSQVYILFILCDLLQTFLMGRIAECHARHLLIKQLEDASNYNPGALKLLLKTHDLKYTKLCVIAMCLFNPYSVVTCIAKSTAIFTNLSIVTAMYFIVKGQQGKACAFIALSTYLGLYPVMLVVPAALFLARKIGKESGKAAEDSSNIVSSLVKINSLTTFFLVFLIGLSFVIEGSFDFLSSTYGFILSVPDLTPNVGVFWYFFTETFEHFRLFFLCVFQINVFIYTVPLAIKLRDHPIFLAFMLIAISCIFKSYPSYADSALYLSFLPMWRHCFSYMRNNFVVACMFFVTTILAPVQYHLWIYAGSANANFYFAITLVFSTAQVFLVTDLLFGLLRREFDLYNGPEPKKVDGKPVPVVLDG